MAGVNIGLSMITAISRGRYPFIVAVIVLPPGLKHIKLKLFIRDLLPVNQVVGQPRPQGFSLKPFFKGKALGTRLVEGQGSTLDSLFSFYF